MSKSTPDIVIRLRENAQSDRELDAADEIERLRKDIDQLVRSSVIKIRNQDDEIERLKKENELLKWRLQADRAFGPIGRSEQ